MEPALLGKTVISLCGYQGSGKTTVGRAVAKLLNTEHIEVSNVVKDVAGDELSKKIGEAAKRSNLALTGEKTKRNPNWLGRAVAKRIKACKNEVVVITGTREQQVHRWLVKQGAKLYSFEMRAPAALRYHRVKELKKVVNAREFLEHELKERELGLDKVLEKAPYTIPTSDDTRPSRIARAIKYTVEENES